MIIGPLPPTVYGARGPAHEVLGTGHPVAMEGAPVIVQPPGTDGGRRVTIRGEHVGIAYHLLDVVEFLRRAGLPEVNTTVDDPELIEWRGGGPTAWTAAE